MVIDSHNHFWKYNPADYGWIDESMSIIRRDFLPADLRDPMMAAGVDGTIAVQARQSLEETHWLLNLAAENASIRGVVGWVSLVSEHVRRELETVGADPKLRGVRHVLQGESEDHFMLRDDFNRGVGILKEFGLAYDLLIFERHLPVAGRFVDLHPEQVFILDHLAKPKIKAAEREPWAKHLQELAKRPNVYCKASGIVTEADWQSWTPPGLREYFNIALEAFGPDRIMAGSDWPVCLVACGYKRWWDILREWISALSETEQSKILGDNAVRAYKLK
jgi:L-fuconolactonase